MRDKALRMNESGIDVRMSKTEGGVTRRETTTVNDVHYDVIRLEKDLETNPELANLVEISLSDPRISDAIAEGNRYWESKSGESLGPSHFINLWNEQKNLDTSVTLDEFLENLKTIHPDWIDHISSIQFAKNNLSRPIWLYADEKTHAYPFDGMHRLTRAYLEEIPAINTLVWNNLPEDAKLE